MQEIGKEAVGMLQAGAPRQRLRSDARSPTALLDLMAMHSKVVEGGMDGGAELRAVVEQLKTELLKQLKVEHDRDVLNWERNLANTANVSPIATPNFRLVALWPTRFCSKMPQRLDTKHAGRLICLGHVPNRCLAVKWCQIS